MFYFSLRLQFFLLGLCMVYSKCLKGPKVSILKAKKALKSLIFQGNCGVFKVELNFFRKISHCDSFDLYCKFNMNSYIERYNHFDAILNHTKIRTIGFS